MEIFWHGQAASECAPRPVYPPASVIQTATTPDSIYQEERMNSAAPIQSISLYYREGGSDKVYHVQLREVGGGYVVNFQYGRRRSTLQTGNKTSTPVTRTEAERPSLSL